MRDESFQFKPARKVEIPKVDGRMRTLNIASPRDKIVQEIMRMILEAVFEPTFSPNSHGFRPGRGCHTALKSAEGTFRVATWVIEGDLKSYFDCIDHHTLIEIIRGKIKDEKFIRLL